MSARRCPYDAKALTVDYTARTRVCEHCGYREQFGTDRAPLVTAGSARSLVAEYRRRRASGDLPQARRYGWGQEDRAPVRPANDGGVAA